MGKNRLLAVVLIVLGGAAACKISKQPNTRPVEQIVVTDEKTLQLAGPVSSSSSQENDNSIVAASETEETNSSNSLAKADDASQVEPLRTAPTGNLMTLSTKLKKKWTAKIGLTTFRTTMVQVGDTIIIGTHGESLSRENEQHDGVYILNAKNGKTKQFIRTPGRGDRDVGGVAVDNERIYFSTDNSLIVAADFSGKILWRSKAMGKVRPAPALAQLDDDPLLDVVVGDEQGVLRALSGKNGQPIWTKQTGANEYDSRGFIGAAAVGDLNGDGRVDIVAGARDGILAAYEGRTGRVLWQVHRNSGMHASPSLGDFDEDGTLEVLAAWSYGDVGVFNGEDGSRVWASVISQIGGGIEGLFGTPIPLSGDPGVLIAPTAWWDDEDGIVGYGNSNLIFKTQQGRVSASAVVGDLDNDGVWEAIIGTEKGQVLALHADGGIAELLTARGSVEAPVLLADVDRNGTYELLVASNDGRLNCYETGSKTKPALSRFRGDSPQNKGHLGAATYSWYGQNASSGGRHVSSKGNIRLDYLMCCEQLQKQAVVAPVPRNKQLLKAAATCNLAAAENWSREQALNAIQKQTTKSALPSACVD